MKLSTATFGLEKSVVSHPIDLRKKDEMTNFELESVYNAKTQTVL